MSTRWIRALLRSPVLPLAALVVGGVFAAFRDSEDAQRAMMIGLVISGTPLIWRTVHEALRGHFATDVVATLAVVTAVIQQQPLAGLVVTLMQTGGEALERYAEGRASDAVSALEAEAPRRANRLRGGADTPTEDVEVSEIRVGDFLLVRPGEMIPCDGVVEQGHAHVDTARITGEPVPVTAGPGTQLLSGCINIDGALTMRAEAIAHESQYERIVELVRSAQASKAPLQRLADRYAQWFTPLTLAVCAIAYFVSGDSSRVLSVLVVATPCPLLLATPVAIIGGINRAARRLIVIRSGGALEQLATISSVVFDKTGTLTIGRPAVSDVVALGTFAERQMLTLAASVEERSGHLLARSVVDAARDRGVRLRDATMVLESPGRGIRGSVDGRTIEIGSRAYVEAGLRRAQRLPDAAPGLRAYVSVDGAPAGYIDFADQIRPGLPDLFARLRGLGVGHLVILSGDSIAHTKAVAEEAGISDARGELLPSGKVDAVNELVARGERVLMVGDGTNDAPALSAATVGMALAGHGGGISAEAADVVVLADDLSRVHEAIDIGKRTMHIARQSIIVGLVVSGAAMSVAAAGFIPPVLGAVFQEALDVAVILNALRSSRSPRAHASAPVTPHIGSNNSPRPADSHAA